MVVSNIFYFHPYLGKIPILTNIFQMGSNHQPVFFLICFSKVVFFLMPDWKTHTKSTMNFHPQIWDTAIICFGNFFFTGTEKAHLRLDSNDKQAVSPAFEPWF